MSKYRMTTRPGSEAHALQTLATDLQIKAKTFAGHDGYGWEAEIFLPINETHGVRLVVVDDGWGGGLEIRTKAPGRIDTSFGGWVEAYAERKAAEGLAIPGDFTDATNGCGGDFHAETFIEALVNWVLQTKDLQKRGLGSICHPVPGPGSSNRYLEWRRRSKANAAAGTVAEDERRLVEQIFSKADGEIDWIANLTSDLAVSAATAHWTEAKASA